MSKFTEAKLEHTFIELLENEGFPHFLGNTISRADDPACANTCLRPTDMLAADREVLIEEDLESALKAGLILLLDEHGYPPVERDKIYVEIFEQAENFKKIRQ